MKYLLSLIISGALVVSGFGQTRNVLVGTNNAVVQPTNFWSADASNARTGLGLGTAATNPESAFQPSSSVLSNLASSNAVNLTNLRSTNIVGTLSIAQGGTGSTNAETARTNLGLGWPALTNTNEATALLGYNTTNGQVVYTNTNTLIFSGNFSVATNAGSFLSIGTDARIQRDAGSLDLRLSANGGANTFSLATNGDVQLSGVLKFVATTNAPIYQAQTRTNLGLPWDGLTNTNAATFQTALFGANTNLVLVDTNGEVVSPTNFWQAAPITTTFIESQPTTNFTTNITAARFLHIHSLNTNIVNVTNTIALPTNGSTYNGDVALIVHQGPTNSMTRVRAAGSTNDIATMTRYNEAIEFVYYNNDWTFNHNQAFTEPVYFAGTNAAGHAAESRTNLGLPWSGLTNTNTVTFQTALFTTNRELYEDSGLVAVSWDNNQLSLLSPIAWPYLGGASAAAATRTNLGIPLAALTNTNNTTFRDAIELGATNNVSFSNVTASGTLTATGTVTAVTNLNVGGAINVTNKAETRTNLGIPLAALTNTNNANFQAAVFNTNAAPTPSVNFGDAVAWLEITVQTNGTNASFRIPLYEP